ncbi:MAG: hypothetical protein M1826_006605 [Phylliscum demangeonii]|nr:MAG: hypothetical protein M1826_006605 [Phylliscum demangeonii]
MAGPSKKKVTKKAGAKKATTAKKALAAADKPKPTTTTTTKQEEGQPMAHQLANVTADFHHAVETRGDGDCMYHAISDQLYGHQDAHAAVRATTAAFLRQHRALYRPFVPANAWAEENEGSSPPPSSPRDGFTWDVPPVPTEAEQDQAFDAYVEALVATPGMWGGDLELQALAGAFLVDIVVYQDGRVPFRQEPLDGVLPAGHRPEDRKLLRVAYYGGVHYASVRPLPLPLPASPKRKRTTPDRDPEEEVEAARPRKKPSPSPSPSPSSSPLSPPPPPPVLPRQEPPTPLSPAATPRPPSTWRSASCPPRLGMARPKAKAKAKAKATATAKAKQRPATRPASPAILTIPTIPTISAPAPAPAPALAPAAPAAPAVHAVPAAAAAANGDTSPAVPVPAPAPARAPNDDNDDNDDDDDDAKKWRHVRVRLAGVPGGDIVISGVVRGQLTFSRAGEVLAAYAVEEEEEEEE